MAFLDLAEGILEEFSSAQGRGEVQGLTKHDWSAKRRSERKRMQITKAKRKAMRDRHTAEIRQARALAGTWNPSPAPYVPAPPHAARRWG